MLSGTCKNCRILMATWIAGLGLALVEEILRHHGSHLEITSRAEGAETGTCVSFILSALEGDVA